MLLLKILVMRKRKKKRQVDSQHLQSLQDKDKIVRTMSNQEISLIARHHQIRHHKIKHLKIKARLFLLNMLHRFLIFIQSSLIYFDEHIARITLFNSRLSFLLLLLVIYD